MSIDAIAIGWDPGDTTGVCIIGEDPSDSEGFSVIYSGAVPWEQRKQLIHDLIRECARAHNVAEGYIVYKSKARDQIGSKVPSARVLGLIEAYTDLYHRPLTIWPASVIQRTEIPEHHQSVLLRGEYREHAKDAYKHARYWFVREKHVSSQ